MYLGVVTGTVVASRKAAGLEGQKLLLVQPLDDTGRSTGDVQVAVDTVAAGVGDQVYLVGSREAALALTPWFVPVDAAIVGIVDEVHTPERSAAAPAPVDAATPDTAAPEPVDDDPTEATDTRPRKRPQATAKPERAR
ncbi:MAG: EutN/CcmL family microcompartment protein [Kofleriaceae bacterium]|jgi:ethanolamine utilization protein EutN|nr:EutN/CcmL family microcompartment protein [Kofleriaceae bacterium]MBP9172079.1 EutN/CcmL family microcompartment protein [Kofleriaceae bacterium]MBP9859603.1 EutN/CcmL family microcompartment protein [Kofleriaceae bacterium]